MGLWGSFGKNAAGALKNAAKKEADSVASASTSAVKQETKNFAGVTSMDGGTAVKAATSAETISAKEAAVAAANTAKGFDSKVAEVAARSNIPILKNRAVVGKDGNLRTSIPFKAGGALLGASLVGGAATGEGAAGVAANTFGGAALWAGDMVGYAVGGKYYGAVKEKVEEFAGITTDEVGESEKGGFLDGILENCDGLTAVGAVAAVGGMASKQTWLTVLGVALAGGSYLMNYLKNRGEEQIKPDDVNTDSSGEDEIELTEEQQKEVDEVVDHAVQQQVNLSGPKSEEELAQMEMDYQKIAKELYADALEKGAPEMPEGMLGQVTSAAEEQLKNDIEDDNELEM